MPQCKTCIHEDRDAIDKALIRGESDRAVASRYSLSRASVQRHRKGHLKPQLKAAATRRKIQTADDLLTEAEDLHRTAREILDEARKASDKRTAVSGINAAARTLELHARLMGELRDATGVSVNVLAGPGAEVWIEVSEKIMKAIEDAPDDVREKVARAVAEVGP